MAKRAADLIQKLGREEDEFLRREFLAPVRAAGKVRVRLGGIVCEMAVVRRPGGFEDGWAILKPVSHREAEVVRAAPLADVKRYLGLFPRGRLVAAWIVGRAWLGVPAAAPEKGARVEGVAPIAFAGALRMFETAVVRFDGALFLYESSERAAMAGWLRGQLEEDVAPADLKKSGLTAPEREAYAIQWKMRAEMRKPPEQRRLERALALAGAELVSYEPRAGLLTVTWRVDGAVHTSLVSGDDLTVVSAGICLDGADRDFDLTTLVPVLREHRARR
ncbi:MAG: hypothetical protein HYY18_01615 [Planctomycetes bacterium]|nr:hypothetical protein [Planctomycetota bacterium]